MTLINACPDVHTNFPPWRFIIFCTGVDLKYFGLWEYWKARRFRLRQWVCSPVAVNSTVSGPFHYPGARKVRSEPSPRGRQVQSGAGAEGAAWFTEQGRERALEYSKRGGAIKMSAALYHQSVTSQLAASTAKYLQIRAAKRKDVTNIFYTSAMRLIITPYKWMHNYA